MKLKKLLKVIPEGYKIGFTSADNKLGFITYDNKKDAVMNLAYKMATVIDLVEELEVVSIHPCARTYCRDYNVYSGDMPELCVEPRLLVEVNLGGV